MVKKIFKVFICLSALSVVTACGSKDSQSSIAPTKTKYMDVVYSDFDKNVNLVDIYLPTNSAYTGKRPLVIYNHGGGWSSNSRKITYLDNAINGFLKAGYAVAKVEYHLDVSHYESDLEVAGEIVPSVQIADETKYPQMIYDIKAAVRYLRANADTYNLDPNNFFFFGDSAGAHLSMLAAATENNPSYEDQTMGYENVSTHINGIISLFGPSLYSLEEQMTQLSMLAVFGKEYTEEQWKHISPYYQLGQSNTFVPTFFAHGEKDNTVPISHSREMEAKVKSILGDDKVETYYHADGTHADSMHFASNEAVKLYREFLKKYTV